MNTPIAQVPGDPIALLNIQSDGEYPKKRVPTPEDARGIVATLVQSSRSRNYVNARVKGMIDGNKPYDPAKLKNAAQLYRCNVNFLEGSAKSSAAKVPYYDLFSGATYYADIRTSYGSEEDKVTFSRILSEEFTRTCKDWKKFDWNIQAMLNDLIDYGKGFLVWNDKTDWQFQMISQAKFLFPDGTQSFPDDWEVVVIRKSFQVNELANMIRNESAATAVGWNVGAVKDAIFNAMPKTNTNSNTLYDYDFVQQQIKDHDILQGIRCKTVQGAILYVKEFDGRITQLIVTESEQKKTDGHTEDSREFLFEAVGYWDCVSDAISAFIFEVRDGSVNGVQGLGHQLYAPMEIKNRLMCSTMDLAFMRSGITLQAQTAGAYQKLNLVQIGGFNVIPPDFAVQQSTIMGDMNSPIEANRFLDEVVANNTGIYRSEGQQQQTGNPRTYGEVKLEFMNSTILSNSSVNRFYSQLDRTYYVMVHRLCNTKLPKSSANESIKAAIDFQKRCKDRGVPEEVFNKIESVAAYRVSGNGSLFMRTQAVASMQPYIGMLPESGKQAWLEDMVALTTNQQMVERYVPSMEKQKLPTDQQDLALLENAAMKMNAPVTWTPTQNNIIHAQTHLLAAAQASESLNQGANPMEVLMFLKAIGSHTAFHLKALATDPARQQGFKILEQQWKQLASTTDKLQEQVKQLQEQKQKDMQTAARAQAVANATDPQTQLDIAQAKQDMAIKGAKADQAIGIKNQKAQQDMALKDAQTADEIQRNQLLASQGV